MIKHIHTDTMPNMTIQIDGAALEAAGGLTSKNLAIIMNRTLVARTHNIKEFVAKCEDSAHWLKDMLTNPNSALTNAPEDSCVKIITKYSYRLMLRLKTFDREAAVAALDKINDAAHEVLDKGTDMCEEGRTSEGDYLVFCKNIQGLVEGSRDFVKEVDKNGWWNDAKHLLEWDISEIEEDDELTPQEISALGL